MGNKLSGFLFGLLAAWSISTGSLAEEAEIKGTMQDAAHALSSLMPYIYNDQAFRTLTNKGEIEQNIDKLISITRHTPGLLADHAVTMLISQQSLLNTLEQAKSLYRSCSYSTAQYLLSGVPMVCSSCHIQDGKPSNLKLHLDRSLFANDFSYAEFNYYLRNYHQAKAAYEAHLNQTEIQRSRIQSRKTLERLLDINLLTSANTTQATEQLKQARALPNLNNDAQEAVLSWLTGLETLSLTPPELNSLEQSIYSTFNEQFTLEHEFIFNEENRPKALLWRKQLHQLLKRPLKKQDTARALYLISILERTLGDQSDASLANLYLEECIRLQVRVYSLKCMNEFENHLYFYYGGSSGEHLPDAAHEQLQTLKRRLGEGDW